MIGGISEPVFSHFVGQSYSRKFALVKIPTYFDLVMQKPNWGSATTYPPIAT